MMRSPRIATLVAVAAVALVALVAGVAGPLRAGEPVLGLDLSMLVQPCDDEPATIGPPPRPRSIFQDCDDENDEDPLAEWWDQHDLPGVFSVGVLLVTVLAWLGAAVLAGWLLFRLAAYLRAVRLPSLPQRRPVDDVAVEAVDALREAVDLAAHEAESALPGRASDAVVACWVLLEDAAARVGSARSAPQTPTEFTTVLLTRHQPDRKAVDTLLRLYHRARFGSQPLPDEAAEVAGDALRRIAAGLRTATSRTGGVA